MLITSRRSKYPFPGTEFKVAAVEKLKSVGLTYTRFITGTFMDYFGPPAAPSKLLLISMLVDFAANKAVVPGDGNQNIVTTHSTDVARFVTAALDLQAWDERYVIVGQRLTVNELVAFAEAAAGTTALHFPSKPAWLTQSYRQQVRCRA